MRKCLAIWGVLILVSAGVAFAQAPSFITTITQQVSSGMFTLTTGGTATAKVNVLNLGGLTFPTSGTCAATISFFDGSGSTTPVFAKTITNLGTGQAGSVSYSGAGTFRVAISYPLTPTVTNTTTPVLRASCSLIPTLELQTGTGAGANTVVFITQFNGVPQIQPLTPLLSRP